MHVLPTTPTTVLEDLRQRVATATGIDADWVFLTPAPELLGRLPPASAAFAAVVPEGVSFPESPQHQQLCPADMRVDVCLFSRVALDRAFDGGKLLTDGNRGLFPFAHKVVKHLAGNPLESPSGQLARGPIQCLGIDTIRWAEGANIILAYAVIRFLVPILYDLS